MGTVYDFAWDNDQMDLGVWVPATGQSIGGGTTRDEVNIEASICEKDEEQADPHLQWRNTGHYALAGDVVLEDGDGVVPCDTETGLPLFGAAAEAALARLEAAQEADAE